MRHPLRQLSKLHDWHVRIHCRLLLIPCMLGRSHKNELKMLLQFDNVPFPERSVLKTHKVLLFGAICPVLSAIFSVIGRMLSNELWKPELFSFPFVAQESTVSPPHGWQHCWPMRALCLHHVVGSIAVGLRVVGPRHRWENGWKCGWNWSFFLTSHLSWVFVTWLTDD